MQTVTNWLWGVSMAMLASIAGNSHAATYVYVSNAEDGDIGAYTLQADGKLTPNARTKVANLVMPLTVSTDKRFLYAASRSKPFSLHTLAIAPATGALNLVGSVPSADSFPYISLDKSGRYLFGASYGGHLVAVNAIAGDGRIEAKPLQVIPVGRNAHSIRIDADNRFVFVPTLGSDEIFEFTFDAKSGHLVSNTPAVALMKAMTGPRHFVFSRDN